MGKSASAHHRLFAFRILMADGRFKMIHDTVNQHLPQHLIDKTGTGEYRLDADRPRPGIGRMPEKPNPRGIGLKQAKLVVENDDGIPCIFKKLRYSFSFSAKAR